MNYTLSILFTTTILLISCNGNDSINDNTKTQVDSLRHEYDSIQIGTTTTTVDTLSTTTTTVDTLTTIPKSQIKGIAIKNVAEENVFFYIQDGSMNNEELSLAPYESNDYKIKNVHSVIKVKGQVDKWQVDKLKRYIFQKVDDKWVLNEVEL